MNAEDSSDHGVLWRLSVEALQSAAALEGDDPETLFEHLYTANRIPLSPRWLGRMPDTAAVRRELGLNSPTDVGALLAQHWLHLPEQVDTGWLMWVRPGSGGELGSSGSEVKLYVSPAIEALGPVFSEVVRVATFGRAEAVKVGAHVASLLRPDKLVVYFSSLDDLADAAHLLTQRLEGVPAHGVPFTAEISGYGLLSWGRDPPKRESASAEANLSWREWLCRRLAAALVEARSEAGPTRACWRSALERIRAEGVDTDRWSPTPDLWSSPPW
jgi:hypothetical protein